MSIVVKCDRCGKETDSQGRWKIDPPWTEGLEHRKRWATLDFCSLRCLVAEAQAEGIER